MNKFLISLSLLTSVFVAAPSGYAQEVDVVIPEVSPKLTSGNHNPLLDFMFTADPTAVEHDGRLYVYATNDHEEYETVGGSGKNSYQNIKSLVMMSTDDMVNWTYHGTIKVGEIAPWTTNSWAPSAVKTVDGNGVPHFFIYFSNNGHGTAVLTATSPVGPWTSPLNKNLIDSTTPGVEDCKVLFDPGAVVDEHGVGWLAVGGACSRFMKLGKDMVSIDSKIITIDTPHHFEANELNYINGTYVYTYNVDWQKMDNWTLSPEKPTICNMVYLTSKNPLVADSWQYRHNYFRNPGEYGFEYGNNHTHLHKFRNKWYVFYHTMSLQHSFGTRGGFRNVCVDEITVDENDVNINMGTATLSGPAQIQPLNPFVRNQAETVAATQGIRFTETSEPGNTVINTAGRRDGVLLVKGAIFVVPPIRIHAQACGKGTIEVRKNGPKGTLMASIPVNCTSMQDLQAHVKTSAIDCVDVCFVLKGNISLDFWQFMF